MLKMLQNMKLMLKTRRTKMLRPFKDLKEFTTKTGKTIGSISLTVPVHIK